MADEDTSQEKTEEPTSRKIEKSKEEGNIARSKELNTSAILIVSALCILVYGPGIAENMIAIMKFCFSFDPRASWDVSIAGAYFSAVFYKAFIGLLPIYGFLVLAAFMAPISLGGWNFATKAIAPKASRLNPLSECSC